jgi:hypothetical protein
MRWHALARADGQGRVATFYESAVTRLLTVRAVQFLDRDSC